MMSWLADHIPLWWMLPFLAGGGGIAALVFVPGMIPAVIGFWNASPLWLRVLLVGLTGGLILYLKGRHDAQIAERDRERERDAAAINNRRTIDHEVQNLDRLTADKRLDRWMRD